MAICLAQQPDADALLDQNPLALLLGMLYDQQFPMERAFFGPYLVEQRLGQPLSARMLADADPDQLVALFTLASAGCALSQHIGMLVFFRAVQGFVGGAMIPTVFSAGLALPSAYSRRTGVTSSIQRSGAPLVWRMRTSVSATSISSRAM